MVGGDNHKNFLPKRKSYLYRGLMTDGLTHLGSHIKFLGSHLIS